jgi:two-component system sensor histidine kinase UhpB
MRQLLTMLLLLLALQPALAKNDTHCDTLIDHVMVAPEQRNDGQRPTEGWQTVSLPDMWSRHWPDFTGAVWYRVDWHTNCQQQAMALNVQNMAMAGQIYLNDILLWQDQQLNKPMSRHWNTPRYWVLLAPGLQEHNTLWFRLVSPPHLLPGLGTVTLGTTDQVWPVQQNQYFFQRQIYTINLIISLTLAVLFGVFWLMRRDDHAFGWFSVTSLCWSLWLSNILATSPWPFSSNATWDQFNTIFYMLYCSFFCMFTWSFGALRPHRMMRLLWSATILLTLAIFIVPSQWLLNLLPMTSVLYTLIMFANWLQFIVHALRTRDTSHLLLAACLACGMLILTHTLLANFELIDSEQQYSAISAPIISICLFLILALRYRKNLLRIASFNEELQSAITQTKEELTRTLQHENALEADNIRLHERLRMTHDLHDSLGSSLMHSISMVGQSTTIGGKQFLSILRELRNDLRHIIDGTSENMSLELTNPTVWIAPLRRRFTAMFDDLGIDSEWHLPEQWPNNISAAQLLELTRFLEEALTNVLKHSHATQLSVRITAVTEQHEMLLEVADNGQGFDVNHILSTDTGIGMRSMVRRIKRINGTLDITSTAGATILTVRIPCE